MSKKYSQEEIEILKKYYPIKGRNYCSKLLKRTPEAIGTMAYKLNIKTTKERRIELMKHCNEIQKNKPKTYKVDPWQFMENFSPESAYILGLLWADGSLDMYKKSTKILLGCIETDIQEIYPIFLKTGPWAHHVRYPPNRQPLGIVQTSNKKLFNFLLEHNYRPHNTNSADSIIKLIPEHLQHYWFRGLIDGDGCWFVSKTKITRMFSINSCYEQNWNYAENLFKKLKIKKYNIRRILQKSGSRSSMIKFCGKENFIKMGNYIYYNYENDQIGLSRKYKKYKEVIDSYIR